MYNKQCICLFVCLLFLAYIYEDDEKIRRKCCVRREVSEYGNEFVRIMRKCGKHAKKSVTKCVVFTHKLSLYQMDYDERINCCCNRKRIAFILFYFIFFSPNKMRSCAGRLSRPQKEKHLVRGRER